MFAAPLEASSLTGTTNGHSLSLMQPVCVMDEQITSSGLKQGHYTHENMHPKVCVRWIPCILNCVSTLIWRVLTTA